MNSTLTAGVRLDGRFELQRPLEGGSWRAFDHEREREVDVTLLPLPANAPEDAKAAFEAAAKQAIALGHSARHLVTVLAYGFVDLASPGEVLPHGYLVTEALQGETLAARVKKRGRLRLRELRPLVHQLARALQALHAQDVWHLGVRPDRVFITREGGEEVAKLLDGLVTPGRLWPRDAAAEPAQVPFMSPEHLSAGTAVDGAADVWSLAATIYAATVGRPPFGGFEEEGLEARILWKPVPPPSQALGRSSPGLDLWISRGMAREPHARFASLEELAQAFEAVVLDDEGERRLRIPLPFGLGGEDVTFQHGLRAQLMARAARERLWSRKTWLLLAGCLVTFILGALLVGWLAAKLQAPGAREEAGTRSAAPGSRTLVATAAPCVQMIRRARGVCSGFAPTPPHAASPRRSAGIEAGSRHSRRAPV